MEHIVRDAAAPFGRALTDLKNSPEYHGRTRDLAISYHGHGAVAAFADRTTHEQQEQMTRVLTTAFTEVGWRVEPWGYGPGLALRHPIGNARFHNSTPDETSAAAPPLSA
ncbi:hypothetical protein DBP19_36660 [Streptomyces sp. CS090A]|uniref:hypothetical protein n=1 Tax=Streptomyces sp. CS090A TaxID=2162710 RepID=UPI000D51E6D7|nr:hypothetical protein [Streptomyces sp. CS090A]PVC80386.1 hypothetical protein DBP19_36660 [Streptomyces sp. CS090A]